MPEEGLAGGQGEEPVVQTWEWHACFLFSHTSIVFFFILRKSPLVLKRVGFENLGSLLYIGNTYCAAFQGAGRRKVLY